MTSEYVTEKGEIEPMPICEGCGNEIDPSVCQCGSDVKDHTLADNHPPTPMGCDCRRDRSRD